MTLFFILGIVIMCQGILQAAQLLIGITAKSVDGCLREK